MGWQPLRQRWVSASVDVVFAAARPPTAEAQLAGRSLPVATAKHRALMLSGSAAVKLHTKQLYLRRFSKLIASREIADIARDCHDREKQKLQAKVALAWDRVVLWLFQLLVKRRRIAIANARPCQRKSWRI